MDASPILSPLGVPAEFLVNQNFFCGNFTKGPIEYAFVGVSSFLYFMLLIVALVVAVQGCRSAWKGGLDLRLHHPTVERGQKLRLSITILLIIQLITRIMSSIFNLLPGDEMYAVWWATSRIANVCGVTAFALVGTLWLSIGHHARDPPKMNQRTFDRINIIGAIVFGVALAGYAVATVAVAPNSGPGALVFETHVIIVSAIQLLMMIFFTIYGLVLYILIRRASRVGPRSGTAGATDHNAQRPARTGSIARVGAMYSFFFFSKSIVFSYRIITHGCFLPHWFFWTLAYYLPELAAETHLLWSYYRINQRQSREKQEYRRLARGRAAGKYATPTRTPASNSKYSTTSSDLPHFLDENSGDLSSESGADADHDEPVGHGSGNLGEAAFEYATSPGETGSIYPSSEGDVHDYDDVDSEGSSFYEDRRRSLPFAVRTNNGDDAYGFNEDTNRFATFG